MKSELCYQEVIDLLMQGKKRKEIASELGITEQSVGVQIKNAKWASLNLFKKPYA